MKLILSVILISSLASAAPHKKGHGATSGSKYEAAMARSKKMVADRKTAQQTKADGLVNSKHHKK